jgi:hypothetical protein
MPKPTDTTTPVMPSALPPTQAELTAWNALSRDEQVKRYREFFAQADCHTFTEETPDEILAAARARIAARQHG